jgi:hypothetical protein
VGSSQYPGTVGPTQEPCSGFRRRHCLLKGCEQPFRPARPQARYCSDACRQEARRWRRWRSSRTYRASEGGKECRRQQSCRYRERQREAARQGEVATEEAAQLDSLAPREGQRPACIGEDFAGQSCRRPGCYVLFPIRPGVPQQRYCSCRCRHALRRVLDRESRWRCRHHRQRRRRIGRPHPS